MSPQRSSATPLVDQALGEQAVEWLHRFEAGDTSALKNAHYSTTQRYLHHKPRPEHAAALHAAFGGSEGKAAAGTLIRE